MSDDGRVGRRELWLATESGPLLHRPSRRRVVGPVALCSREGVPVQLGWFSAAPSPFAPLKLPRPVEGSWPDAVRAWAPVAEAFEQLRRVSPGDAAALRAWLVLWLAYRESDGPSLTLERYSRLRASLPQPTADSLAIAGVSGISGLCSICRRR